MEKGSTNGKTAEATQVSTNLIKSMVLVHTLGLMGVSISESGLIAKGTAKAE